MGEIKILVVEDDRGEVRLCRRAARRFNANNDGVLHLEIANDFEDATTKLDKSFDGALIDLRLDDDDDAGNRLVQMIEDHEMRVPVIILTGTPGNVRKDLSYVEVHKRSAVGSSYDDIIARFKSIYDTGITKILGGRGQVENMLGHVFRHQIAPQIGQWEPYGAENPQRTENALLRHVIYHLVQLIDEEAESSFPEEFFLHPSWTTQLRTGAIIDGPATDLRYVVMSPDCDLVVRKGKRKTDNVLLAEIVPPTAVFPNYESGRLNNLNSNDRRNFRRALVNNFTLFYHCVPETGISDLGFIDFRRLKTVPESTVDALHAGSRKLQIAPPFVKDIVSRFSTYYARQGQPVIVTDRMIS